MRCKHLFYYEIHFSGMVRVGDLSKGLLLASDRAVNLILLCKHIPSLTLLHQIQKLIVEKLSEVVPNNEYQIHSFDEEAGFCVVAMPDSADSKHKDPVDPEKELPYAVNVTLTSTSLRQSKGLCYSFAHSFYIKIDIKYIIFF